MHTLQQSQLGHCYRLACRLHQPQTGDSREFAHMLHGIRRESVEAETIDQSITKFIDLINQAYSQSFNKP